MASQFRWAATGFGVLAAGAIGCGSASVDGEEDTTELESVASQEQAYFKMPFIPPARNFIGCTAEQKQVLFNAFMEAYKRVANGRIWLLNATWAGIFPSPTDDWRRYTRWFGPWDGLGGDRFNRVLGNTTRLYEAFWGTDDQYYSNHWDARCSSCTDGYAKAPPYVPWTIEICPSYFTELPRWNWFGELSQPGVLIHEMSHFAVVANTLDYAYNYPGAIQLAVTDPAAATNNADNYSCFFSNQDNLPLVR